LGTGVTQVTAELERLISLSGQGPHVVKHVRPRL
jgi:hypothetical protein